MELKADFRLEYLKHFSNCLSSLSRLSCNSKGDVRSYVNFTPSKVYVISRNLFGIEGYAEILTNQLFRDNPLIINDDVEGNHVFFQLDIVRLHKILSIASTSNRVSINLIKKLDSFFLIVSFDDVYYLNTVSLDIHVVPLPNDMLDECCTPNIPLYQWNVALPKASQLISFLDAASKLGSEFVDFKVSKSDPGQANLTLIANSVMVNTEINFSCLKLFMSEKLTTTSDTSSIVRTVNTRILIQIMRDDKCHALFKSITNKGITLYTGIIKFGE